MGTVQEGWAQPQQPPQPANRYKDLEIDQDLDFQEKEWRVERIAWGVLLLIAVLGMPGLFDTGLQGC